MPKSGYFYNHKKLTIKIITSIYLSLSTQSAYPQLFNADQNPPTVKWRQINTENFQIIYPSEFESEAQRMSNILEISIKRVAVTLNKKPKKISIILQNQGTTANGFVQLAPRRSEFFTTPSQSFDYQDWLNSLAVHELRHVVQFDKLTGKYNFPPFETLALSIFGISLPPWFYEGDAVNTETSLTNAGRGRIPEWSVILKTNTVSSKKISYSKNYFGSFKVFNPGYYQLGYFMNSKLRNDYGKGIMDSLFTRMSNFPLRPYNLSNSTKKFTGLSTRKLHAETSKNLKEKWENQLRKINYVKYNSINRRKDDTPENFLFPTAINANEILYLKESKASTPAFFILKNDGKSIRLFNIGYQETSWFSYAADKIVWDESRVDLRYKKRSFNVICIYNISTRKAKQLTHRSRLFAPAISPDGKYIIAVEVSTSNQISLVKIDAQNGKQLGRYLSPQNNMLQMPSFNSDGTKLVAVSITTTGKTLVELDLKSGTFNKLIPYQFQEILRPVYADGQVVFKAHYNGVDNIYRLDFPSKQIFQLSSAKFGAYNPSFDNFNKRILFNNYQVLGQDIAQLNWQPQGGKNIKNIEDTYVGYADTLFAQEGAKNVFDSIPAIQPYPTKRYRELSHLFNFHSLSYVTTDNSSGVELESDNKLNTLSFYAGYQYNNALRKSAYNAGLFYKRFYPIVSLTYENLPELINRQSVVNGQRVFTPVTWREHEVKSEVTFPFSFNRFNNTYSAGFKVGTSFTNRYNIDKPFRNLAEHIWFPMHYQVSASRSTRRSSRDLGARWGQSFSLTYRHFPFDETLAGDLIVLKSSFLFPGIIRNHSFQAQFNWQNRSGQYQNTVDIPRVSGYSYLQSAADPYNTLFFTYRMPLFYPDWELGPIAYIKRIRAGFFADFQNVKLDKPFQPRTYGLEVRGDMNLLRFYLPNFDIGGKLIFLNEKPRQNPIFELVASYSF